MIIRRAVLKSFADSITIIKMQQEEKAAKLEIKFKVIES